MNEEKRLEHIKNIISTIPFEPGIYMMKDESDKIIYVGKAISLRKRVRQYFQKNNKSQRIEKMVSLVHNISYIVTRNEVEALVLECNYIKQHSPKFNVMLKDDKTYPYIKVTVNDKYPLVYITRNKREDKSLYFGPYTNVKAVREVLDIIKQVFPLKRCRYNLEKRKDIKPCLYYHIGRCLGPCGNEVDLQEYKAMINQVVLFLQGKTKTMIDTIKLQIDDAIEKLEFEKAQVLKERLIAIEKVNMKQQVDNLNEINTDIFGYILHENKLYIQVFKIRQYKIVLHDNLEIDDIILSEVDEVLSQIISQYYIDNKDIPKKIYIKLEETKLGAISEFLSGLNSNKVEVITPKRGQKLQLIQMVENNININIENAKNNTNNVIQDLKLLLDIKREINIIECYDISNLGNDYIVGCMIRFEDGKLNKKMYRKFKIKSTLSQNDPLSMYEVLSRRLKHLDDWGVPDLILIDGGKTQLSAVKKALDEYNSKINTFGMVKNNKHRTRGLLDLDGNEINLEVNNSKINNKKILNFITFLQDEVHRFTIKYHRSLRDKI